MTPSVEFRLTGPPGEPALHRAARLGDHVRLRQLVEDGHDVNRPADIRLDPGARATMATPLMVAAGSGDGARLETMRLLLALGADPARTTAAGTIARFAAGGLGWRYRPGGDAARLRLCLELGCDPNETDGRGVSLLAEAAGTGDAARVDLLLEAGADPNGDRRVLAPGARGPVPGSPLDDRAPYSFRIPLHTAIAVDRIAVVRRLIAAGADVHALDQGGRTALFGVRSAEVARALVDAGLALEARDGLGWSPLVAAVVDGSLDGVTALLSAGADVHATHDRGFTVFMAAVSAPERHLDIMDALIAAGADPRGTSDLGWNAFHAAIDVNGAEANSEASVRSTFERLAALGVDINQRDAAGMSPLDRARRYGSDLHVQVLRELGAVS